MENRVSFEGVKPTAGGLKHPSSYGVEVGERVELNLHFSSEPVTKELNKYILLRRI
jgi:hypothetical protein